MGDYFFQVLGDKMDTEEWQRRQAERRKKVGQCVVLEGRCDWWLHGTLWL